VLGLITNEIKKQSIQGPTLTSDDVKRMIEEKISTLPKPTLTPVMDEASITNLVQANLPKALTESDIQTIIQSTIMSQSTQIDTNLASLVATEVNKQLNQDSRLTQDDVKSMIEEAIAKIPTTSVNMPKPSVPQPDQTPRVSASLPLEMIMPVVKKKNARAPENDKRAEQFKSVMTPDLGMTRTGKKKIVRIPFQDRMAIAEPMMLGHYDDLKNYILSYQVKSRISNTGDMFRLHKEEFVKITIAGKSLKLYLALNPEDYKDSPIPVDDASDKKIYQQIPLVFKVKSDLSLKRAKKLVDDLMAKKGLVQKEIPFLPWSKAFIK
jgi:predicted transport protein